MLKDPSISFAIGAVLSFVVAVFFLSNFSDEHWLDVILATASIAGAGGLGYWIWSKHDESNRTYGVFLALILAFWLVVWFWYADDFCPTYWVLVIINASQYALFCLGAYWMG